MDQDLKLLSADEFLALASDGAEFSRVQLRGADLSQYAASGLALRACCFEQVDLSDVDWEKLKCTACRFVNCQFVGANLEKAVFENCSFFDAEQSLSCNFMRATLRGASFKKCDLSACVFEGADLTRICIQESNAVGARFFRANFNASAKINHCKLRYADLRGANLAKCDLSQNDLVWAALDEADLSEATLIGSDLSGTTTRYTKFAGADLRGAVLTTFDPHRQDLRGVKIFESQMRRLLENGEIIIFPDSR
jgi:fluoroquinolone resistance protein